jgi:hypothetical protein
MVHRIGCLSDTHETALNWESRSLFPSYINSLDRHLRQPTYRRIRDLIHECHTGAINALTRKGKLTALFHFGDLSGGWQELGLSHPKVRPVAAAALHAYQDLADSVGICWGNHDTGYADISGKLNLESVQACACLSPLFWKRPVGLLLFLGVCSPLLQELSRVDQSQLYALQQDQCDFVRDTLRQHQGQSWILCTHDPAVGQLAKVAGPHHGDLLAMICGDKHMPWAGKLIRAHGYVQRGFAGLCHRRAILCPSTAPLWWQGCTYLEGLVEDGRLTLKRRDYATRDLKQRVQRSPFSHPHRCLRWMLKAKLQRKQKS